MKNLSFLAFSIILITPFICLAGDITGHQIIVPEEFLYGRDQEAFAGTSPIERYIETYERTWWKVMNAFVYKNADWRNHASFICSGTPAEAQACIDSYNAAYAKIDAYIKVTGEENYRKLVKERLNKRQHNKRFHIRLAGLDLCSRVKRSGFA
jgi:hypothetical protein